MQMSRLVYRKKDASPKLALASISSRCYLSAFPSAVEMQIICARAAMKPPCRQGWANTTLLKGSLVRCSQAYGHQRLHARLKPANDNTASRETPSAFWPAPKMQMSRLVYRKKDASPKLALASISSRCYLSALPSAVEMQIICARAAREPSRRQGVLKLMDTRDCMPGLKPVNDNTAPRETPSAFWPAPKMQMSRLVYRKKDASPKLALASFSSRCYLSAFPSAVEMQIICARAAMKPPCRQGWANTTLLKGSRVRCSQAYGHQRLHARPEASKWQHSVPGNSICILASSQNADETSGI